jgi:mannobiose 2-epimerase
MDDRETIARFAERYRRRLPGTILPYWLARSRDDSHGGYLLQDDVRRSWVRRAGRLVAMGPRPPLPDDKQLVDQARLLWVFSHAHRKGLGNGETCLRAATVGYQFLVEHFLDPMHGGYAWTTDRSGRTVNPVKHLYGQAFVVFGFVEYARASGEKAALDHATALHRAVEQHLHDHDHGGWHEHGDADWRVITDDDRRIQVPFPGRKSGNTILHWIEALTELYTECGGDQVRHSLTEALAVSRRHLFPSDPTHTCEQRMPDWALDPDADNPASYGHNVEFVWLMVRAERALGREPSWDQFHAYLDHTLRYGFDHLRGGSFSLGPLNQPADRRHKVWWVQSELVAALTDALAERDDQRYTRALAQTLTFMERHMTDRRDGVALQSVREDGRRHVPRKSGYWKAGYHEVRAAVRLVETFAC